VYVSQFCTAAHSEKQQASQETKISLFADFAQLRVSRVSENVRPAIEKGMNVTEEERMRIFSI